jgi:hypothetical protein
MECSSEAHKASGLVLGACGVAQAWRRLRSCTALRVSAVQQLNAKDGSAGDVTETPQQ